jgi:hypothetical protein
MVKHQTTLNPFYFKTTKEWVQELGGEKRGEGSV